MPLHFTKASPPRTNKNISSHFCPLWVCSREYDHCKPMLWKCECVANALHEALLRPCVRSAQALVAPCRRPPTLPVQCLQNAVSRRCMIVVMVRVLRIPTPCEYCEFCKGCRSASLCACVEPLQKAAGCIRLTDCLGCHILRRKGFSQTNAVAQQCRRVCTVGSVSSWPDRSGSQSP